MSEVPVPFESGLIPTRGNVVFSRGEGSRLFDADGRGYLDMTSGHGVAALGHSHPRWAAAVSAQAERLVVCSAAFANDERNRFLELLRGVTPAHFAHVFLCNSGTEAIEGALKFAFLHTGRTGVVALKRSFHGRSLGALATTWNPHYRNPFSEVIRAVDFVQPDDLEALEAALDERIGTMIVEVVQGEGGVNPVDTDYLLEAQRLCRERGVVFVVDEIQTGIGRTGAWFAHQRCGLEPDVMTLAKGLAGGFPIGAVLSSRAVADSLAPGLHGTTFGGNPVACAAGPWPSRPTSESI